MESISKYNFHGIEYVKLDELNALLVQMKKDAREGTKPGYICEDDGKRIAAHGALNHLHAVLNKEKNTVKIHERVERLRKEREAREEKAREEEEKPGSYMVYKPGKKPMDFWVFREWENGNPVVGKSGGMVFTYEGMAQHVADKLGEGWTVIDVCPRECYKAERLLAAIFRDDEAEEEYSGDGTKAEDEPWDE